MKRIWILVVSLSAMLFLFSGAVYADEEQYVKIIPEKTTAAPGEEITFTVVLGPSDEIASMQMNLVIPEGLTFISGKKTEEAEATLKADGDDYIYWGSEKLLFYSYSIKPYSGTKDLALVTFTCIVNADASGQLQVGFRKPGIFKYAPDEPGFQLDDTNSYSFIPATVTIGSEEFIGGDGRNYGPVFDPNYYYDHYADLQTAFGRNNGSLFGHFLKHGMDEGRQASALFDVSFYRNYYPDLRRAFGDDLRSYYIHYLDHGQYENRKAVDDGSPAREMPEETNYSDDGFDAGRYELVFNADFYLSEYEDLRTVCGTDKAKAFRHFLENGMKEGRQASDNFNVQYYKGNYADLQEAFGNNLSLYYEHYINHGYKENRAADGPKQVH